MDENVLLIKKPEDLKDSRAREILQKYDLSIKELDYYHGRYKNKGGKFILGINDINRDPSIIKEFVTMAIIFFEFTKRDRFAFPFDLVIPTQSSFTFYGQDTGTYNLSPTAEFIRGLSIDSCEEYAKRMLRNAESMTASLKQLNEMKKTALKVIKIMGLENDEFDIEIKPNLCRGGELNYRFHPGGRLISILYLRDLDIRGVNGDEAKTSAIEKDIEKTYHEILKEKVFPRNKGWQCKFSEYYSLCNREPGQELPSIAPGLNLDRATITPELRLKGEHVDVCLCALCGNDCKKKERIHKLGRCVLFCTNFSGKETGKA